MGETESGSFEGLTYRHSIKDNEDPDKINPSITEAGRELAEKKGETEILADIKASDGEVVVLMGVSAFKRTRQTIHVFAEGVKNANDPEIEVLGLEEIREYSRQGISIARGFVLERIAAANGKKIVVELPLHLNELDGNEILEKDSTKAREPRLLKEDLDIGEGTIKIPILKPQFTDIMKRSSVGEGTPTELMIKDYLDAQEEGEKFAGIDPNEAADLVIQALSREAELANKYLPGKKVSFVNVTHDWGISLAVIKLLNGGKLDRDAEIMAQTIHTDMAEGFRLSGEGGQIEVGFKGETKTFPVENLEAEPGV